MGFFRKREKKKESWKSILLFVVLALTIRWAVVEAYVIPSGSMLPSLLIHDHIFVNKATYGVRVPFSSSWLLQRRKPERGEVVVFRSPEPEGITLIKRVIAIEGDQVEYDGRILRINGESISTSAASNAELSKIPDEELEHLRDQHEHLEENLPGAKHSILQHKYSPSHTLEPYVVPDGYFFVMGDHRDNSKDSRYWGFVPLENLLGKAEFVWLSCDRSLPLVNLFCDPLTMRWGRLGHQVN